ncbi:Ig-like domain-containing protein [Saccharibacillus sp. CPCC 101409]|uniref:Ig-like domain-containing protein n=1 Tax=Saccharibacillus sp. CPCC 101409 TaxID=3058041 RepID=UPI00267213F3|nr:Ig-like domain-containing protein [Saccharibacillus sp. CPCC 101409]MDO3412093.1 Ig-like domain-containing protein [Saccharibacillus sp. CPCC 101409]
MKRKIALGLVGLMLTNLLAPGAWGTFAGIGSGEGGNGRAEAAVEDTLTAAAYSPKTTNVSLTPGLTVTFDRKVKIADAAGASGKAFTLKRLDNNATVQTFKAERLQIDGDGAKVSLQGAVKLNANTRYYILADSGLIAPDVTQAEIGAGASDKAWSGISNSSAWAFTTGPEADVTDPALTAVTPANGALGVKPAAALGLSFSEAVAAAEGSLVLYEDSDPLKEKSGAAIRISVLSEEVTGLGTANVNILPSAADGHSLKAGVTYGAYASAGTFADMAGNTYKPEIRWTFRTESANNTAPALTGRTPQNGLGGAPVEGRLSLTFDEPVTPNKADADKKNPLLSIYRLNDSRLIATLKPEAFTMDAETGTIASAAYKGLERGTAYYVLIDGDLLHDSDGTAFGGLRTSREWTFTTTGDALALSSLTPASGASGVPAGSSLKLSFTRQVYPNTNAGDIVIRRGDGTVERVQASSGKVTGGGTTELTIVPANALVSGYTYSVEVPAGLLSDSEGNAYPKAGQPLSWTFSTIANSSLLQMVSLTPQDRASDAAVDLKPSIRFNRAVTLSGTGIALYSSGGTKVPAEVSVSASNTSEVVIAPKEKLAANTSYYIDVDGGSVLDRANPGILYAGLKGSVSWGFRTASADKAVPTIKSAAMDSATLIRLTYDKSLNASQTPLLGSYTVTVNGEKRLPGSLYISGDSVYLRLDTGVAVGQDVKVSYDPGVRPLVDYSGNAAVSLGSYAVTNGIDSALPKPTEGSVYGTNLTLQFENSLKSPSSQAYSQFTVTADGRVYSVRSVGSGAQALLLNLDSAVPDGAVVKVSYKPGSAPLQDYLGQNISAFSDFAVRNLMDTKAPEFVGAELSGDELVLNYNEALRTDNLPTNSQFSVLAGGAPVYVTNVKAEGSRVRLTLASALIANGNVTISYVPGALKLTDLNGNAAAVLNLQPVEAASGTSGIRSVVGSGGQIVVTFTGTLHAPGDSAYKQFSVLANGNAVGVTAASLTGSALTLKLDGELKAGQSVALTYQPGGEPLKNVSGANVIAFKQVPVQNNTGLSGGAQTTDSSASGSFLPAADFGREMLILPRAAASSSDATSALGTGSHRYTVKADELKTAFDAAFARGGQEGAVVFEVPDAENSGFVSVPLNALKEISMQRGNMAFAVRYKDAVYEVPLSSLTGVSGGSDALLTIQLESPSSASQERTIGMLGEAGAQLLGSPLDIRIKAESSAGTSSAAETAGIKGTYRLKLNVKSPASRTSVVYFDVNASTPSFVPSKSGDQAAGMLMTGTITGGRMLIPISSTAQAGGAAGHWSQGVVNELAAKYVLSSSMTKAFAPKTPITRGEFAELISRGLGLPADAASASGFSDIGYSKVPIGAIGAAVNAGVIAGNTDGTFRSNDPITREQMAIMMVRALKYAGTEVTLGGSASQVLAPFKDKAKIKYTDDAAKAVQAGIIQGAGGGKFNPQGNATRAEAAAMLQRVLQKAGYLN